MEKPTDIDKEVSHVEYVEAEVLESSYPEQPQYEAPYVRTYSSTGCVPCCGPIGCTLSLLIAGYFLYQFDFIRAVAIALVLFLAVSFFARSITRSTRW